MRPISEHSRCLSTSEIREAISSGYEIYLNELLYFFDNATVSLFVNKRYRKSDVAFELKGLWYVIDGSILRPIRGEGTCVKSALEDLCDNMSNRHVYSDDIKKHYLFGLITAHEPFWVAEKGKNDF